MAERGFTPEKLTADSDYHHWKFNMQMYLMGRDLWEAVEGTDILPEDANADQRRKHKKRDNMAMS